jgi:(S)-2-hydroxyglutarate dehydrogenase
MIRMRVMVVGAGIVGLATAFRLQQRLPDARITVLEKESHTGEHQSSHNSGVLHCGLNYLPGSRRARLAVRGIRQMVEFCQEHRIAHDVCGNVVVAASAAEVPRLHALLERGCQNGLTGLRLLSAEELREIEPHAGGVQAMHVPQEGIADYPAVCETLTGLVREQGGEIVTGARVTCAGLYSDRVAQLAGRKRDAHIVPFRGEYYLLRPERQFLVRNLIYPVPDPRFPFLGVHFTRRILGGIEAGPNAVLAFAREGYSKRDINLADLADSLSFPGLWRFISKYSRTCWDEIRRSFSRELFCRSLQRLVPEIRPDDLIPGGSGVRAQAMSRDGSLLDDFHFVEGDRELHVVNAPSPAATSSLAIGEEIAEMVARAIKAPTI